MPKRDYVPSRENVFADLGLPKPDDLLVKAELAARIIREIQQRRLTQARAAAILRIDQPKISALKQGRLSGFSIERLMRSLVLLGQDVEITVKAKARSRPAGRLRVA
jgi:predicted XRE-type DNA-binding protein